MKEFDLDKNKKYLLACSFGPDSMALFHFLIESNYNFECAIVNYHLRKESDSEVKGLISYASIFNIKVHVKDTNRSLEYLSEATCREIRYLFFASLFKEYNFDALLVAHQEDDHIETYLIQKHRHNCPLYYGISPVTRIKGMEVIRPLLSFSKEELKDICVSNNVPFAIDNSNFNISILRNKYRHEVVEKLNIKEREELINQIKKENEELDQILSSLDYCKIHDVNYLLSLDEVSFQYALNKLCKYIDESQYLSKQNVGEIRKALISKKPNIFFNIKGHLFFVKEYDSIDIVDNDNFMVGYSYCLDKPCKLDTPYFYLDFSKSSEGRNVTSSDYPILIRNVKLTDSINIKGYNVPVRRLFIDWKIPLRARYRWPVIINSRGKVLYIPRYQKDFKPDENTNFYVKL